MKNARKNIGNFSKNRVFIGLKNAFPYSKKTVKIDHQSGMNRDFC
jgi:hypothetical protein